MGRKVSTDPRLAMPTCKSKSRQSGERCKNPPIPFGTVCRFHGGNRRESREIARRAMQDYIVNAPDPGYIKQIRVRRWQESQDRWEMRRAKKAGPEFAAGLARERAAWKAAEKRETTERQRVAAEERAARIASLRAKDPETAAPPAYIPYAEFDFDWSV